jgi:hypothetical protein
MLFIKFIGGKILRYVSKEVRSSMAFLNYDRRDIELILSIRN